MPRKSEGRTVKEKKEEKEKVKLSKEDIYWTNSGYEEYNFRGLSYEQRQAEYEAMKK